jgi:hypothetical protein
MSSPVTTQSTVHLGDSLPAALAAYYVALDKARMRDAAGAFSANMLYAVPPPDVIETDARIETIGRDALLARFEDRGARPLVHDIALSVREGSSCLVEGVSRVAATGLATASFAASAQLDDDGLIARYLAFATSSVISPGPAEAAPALPDSGPFGSAADVLDRYFHALDRGEFEDAAGCFSADALYSHPPYRHTGLDGNHRVEFIGRDELLDAFRTRGAQSFDHRLVSSIQRGPHCILEGLVENLPDGGTGSFISSLTLDEDGLIRRYASFYCEPGVRRT